MMSHCLVPKWNPKQQQQQQQLEAQNASISHHHNNPMSNYEVAELTWENGQLAMHGLSGLPPSAHTKPTWSRAHETLESLVQQATICHQYPNSSNFNIMPQHHDDHAPTSISSTVAPSAVVAAATVDEKSGQAQAMPMMPRKRTRSDSGYCGRNFSSRNTKICEECDPCCGSVSATFCRENNETTMMTWASLESGRSFKSGKSKTIEEDSPSQCGSENREAEEEEREVKGETGRSNPTRRNRAAAIHNQSERRRRDRINQRMKALQRLVPNASKTDKASMLDEVIEYLKQLQAQVQMMSVRGMPPPQLLMMPFAMQQQQQQFQMSMLARMGIGMGLGLGLLNMNTTPPPPPAAASPSLPQLTVGAPAMPTSFMMPPLIQAQAQAQALAPPKPEPGSAPTTNASVSLPADPYATILSQSMNMDFLNNMAALYRQQMRQNNIQGFGSHSQQRHGQDDD